VPVSLEARIGANWLLYAGVATLVLGASYFIKYAFENNWVTPVMRVVLGLAAGLALVEGGRRFSRRGLAFYGQMVAGGGVVILYVAIYAALAFYQLIGLGTAFALMVGITALAGWRAHVEASSGLALLANAGGFLTPFLVGGEARRPTALFAYDAVLVAGSWWLASLHGWAGLHLSSVTLVALTIAAWWSGHDAGAQWLTFELWLTLFAAMFVMARRSIAPGTRVVVQLTRGVLALVPLLYHAASLTLLWARTAGLLVYLIAATAAGTIAAGHTRRPALRLATWLLVSLPAFGWIASRPARWDFALLIAIAALYAMHLVAQLRDTAPGDSRPPVVELILLHLNGLWLWASLGLLFERLLLERLGALTFVLAAWNGALGALLWSRVRETALHQFALAAALVAAGVAVELDGAAVTAAWTIEGGVVAALGIATRRGWLQVAGGALLATAIVRLVQELLAPAGATSLAVLNTRTLGTVLAVGALAWLAARYRREGAGERDDPMRAAIVATLVLCACLLPLIWASAEVGALFAQSAWWNLERQGAGAVTAAGFARDVVLSTLWAGYAIVLIAAGIRRRYPPLRVLAIVVLAVTVGKVFLVDLSRLDRFYRVLSTLGLGLLLLSGSYLYQRFVTRPTSTPARAEG
jgi:uncharacterized membrane protein